MKRILQELFKEHTEDIKGGFSDDFILITLILLIPLVLGVMCLVSYLTGI